MLIGTKIFDEKFANLLLPRVKVFLIYTSIHTLSQCNGNKSIVLGNGLQGKNIHHKKNKCSIPRKHNKNMQSTTSERKREALSLSKTIFARFFSSKTIVFTAHEHLKMKVGRASLKQRDQKSVSLSVKKASTRRSS